MTGVEFGSTKTAVSEEVVSSTANAAAAGVVWIGDPPPSSRPAVERLRRPVD